MAVKFTDHVTYTGQSSTVKEGHAIDMSWASSASGSYWVRPGRGGGSGKRRVRARGLFAFLNTVSIFSLVNFVIFQSLRGPVLFCPPHFWLGKREGRGSKALGLGPCTARLL